MRLHRHTNRSIHGICALGAMVALLLVLAVAASAKPIDSGPGPQSVPPPTVVKETVVTPAGDGPGTIAWVLIAVATGAALVGASYLGARIAVRMTNVRVS
jgi:hypothetical protein